MLSRYKLGLRFKVAVTLTSIILIALFTTSFTSYQQSKKIAEKKAIELQQSHLELIKHEIEAALNQHKNILMSLRDTPSIQAILHAIKEHGLDPKSNESLNIWKQRLATTFTAFLKNQPQYLQIRYIKNSGDELVRVERNHNNQVVITNDLALQNKSNSNYVSETIKLPSGAVYFSDVSLNKEHGKIQQPHTPVLRLATPVYSQEGDVEALVVINLSTNTLFNKVISTNQDSHRYIVDNQGNYIVHKEEAKTFASELDHDYNFFEIESQWANQVKSKEQLMQLNNDRTEIIGFKKIYFAPYDQSRYWLLVAQMPEKTVFFEIRKSLNSMIYIDLFIGAIALILILWLVTKKIIHPISALANSAEKLHQGDLSVRLDPLSVNDEFSSLYQLINDFAQSQQRNTAELEQKIATQTKRLSAVIDNVVDGIITIDAIGTIESFNRTAETIFGYKENDVIGKNVKMLMPDPYHSEHDGYLANHINTGEKKIIGIGREVLGKRKNSSVFPMDLAVSEISLDNAKRFVGIVRDITERKRIEQMQKEFISTVSHELRTPLTSISGSLGLVLGGVTGELPEKAKELLIIANNNSERLIHLINDILDIEKMSAGKMQFDFTVVDIVPVISQAIDANRGYGEKLNVEFTFNSVTSSPLMVRIDEKRIEQVMSNLLSNAAKYSPTGKQVIITLIALEDEVQISVQDQGKGIPEEFRDQIFDKFSQADSSDTRQKGGTGLGLNITKAIIEQHQGQIDFNCEPSQGTTFNVRLPLYENKQPLQLPDEEQQQPPLVLIIEDNEDISTLLVMLIEKAGYTCHQAFDYQQAKDLITTHTYDVITLDLVIPGGDGLTLLKELRSEASTCNLPVIVVASPNNDKHNIEGIDGLEVVDWIEKPINPERLINSISAGLSFELPTKSRILHVEDDADITTIVSSLLNDNYQIRTASSLTQAKHLIATETFDLVLLDVGLPDGSGLELLDLLKSNGNNIPVVIFSAQDIPKEIASQVMATLTKSKTNNDKLIEQIHAVINRKKTKNNQTNQEN
ncbi:hypothetical protein NBRC116592_29860 [Colwellia sp. KU-HH00111]|uniref:response regulator n=1 Tax=Colwellia sp. KU-HH00111 TaxID=3127652 RepID=UPI0031066FD7